MTTWGCFASAGRGALAASTLVAAGVTWASPALAQSGISFGPRVWFQYDNSFQITEDIPESSDFLFSTVEESFNNSAINSPSLSFALIGGSISVPTGIKGTQVIFTGLYGETEEQFQSVLSQGEDTGDVFVQLGASTVGTYDIKRTDLELSVRRTFTPGDRLTLSAVGGVRYLRSDSEVSADTVGRITQVSSVDPGDIDDALFVQVISGDQLDHSFSVRGGASVYAPVNDAHGFFVDAQAALSYAPGSEFDGASASIRTSLLTDAETEASEIIDTTGESSFGVGPDVSVGYRWNVNDRLGFDARYRAQFSFPIDEGVDSLSSKVFSLHGLSFGLSYNF